MRSRATDHASQDHCTSRDGCDGLVTGRSATRHHESLIESRGMSDGDGCDGLSIPITHTRAHTRACTGNRENASRPVTKSPPSIGRAEIESWLAALAGATLVLATPHGRVHCTSSPAVHQRLVEAGHVAFSPLEVLALLRDPEADVGAVVRVKQAFGSDSRVLAGDEPEPARPRRRAKTRRRRKAKPVAAVVADPPTKPRQGVLL